MTRLSIMNVARSSALLLALAACKSTGMGAETRADIAVQMKKAEAPIQTCYGAALKQNRRIKGRFSVRLVAEANTGKFKNIDVLRDEPNDPAVRRCVIDELGKLKLDKPTGTSVQIDQPIVFAPNK